jgi:hypothetical protein
MPTIDPSEEFDRIISGQDFSEPQIIALSNLERRFAMKELEEKTKKKEKKRAKKTLMTCRWCGGKIPLTSKFVQTSRDRGPVHYECLDDWLDWHAESEKDA